MEMLVKLQQQLESSVLKEFVARLKKFPPESRLVFHLATAIAPMDVSVIGLVNQFQQTPFPGQFLSAIHQ